MLVNGYADSATGTPAINQRLSQGRANAVAKELVKMGVEKDNITTKANGGVDELLNLIQLVVQLFRLQNNLQHFTYI